MAKNKTEIYRIKDLETGLYYTGGIFGPYKNELYEQDFIKRSSAEKEAWKWNYKEKKERNYWTGKHCWNLFYKPRWNEIGKIFTNLKGAEKSLSELTGTNVHTRRNPTKNLLFGNKKSNNYVIVPCKIKDYVTKPKKESTDE